MIFYYLIVWFSAVPNQPWFGAQMGGNGFTIFKYVGLVAFLYALGYVAVKGSVPALFGTWQARFFAALVFLAVISYVALGDRPNFFMSPLMSYLSFVFMFFVTVALVDSVPRLRYSVYAIIGALAVASLYLLREWQRNSFRSGYRAGWVSGDSNYFGANAILALALGYFLLRTKLPFRQKLFVIGCSVLTAAALVVSASRGAFIGICFCAVLIFMRSRKKAQILGAGVVFAILLILSPNSPIQRILHPQYSDTTSTEAHKTLFIAGLKVFASHPITGVGLGRFKETMDSMGLFQERGGYIAHDVYVEYAAEMGTLGILLFLCILVSTYSSLAKIRNEARKKRDEFFFAVTSGMQTGLVGFAVASLFLSAEYQKTFWIIIFLSAAIPALFRKRCRELDREIPVEHSVHLSPVSGEREQDPDFVHARFDRI
jgi:O-antigen ligase